MNPFEFSDRMLEELEHIQGASKNGRGRIDHRGLRQASRELSHLMSAPHEMAFRAARGAARVVGHHFLSKASRSAAALRRVDRVAKRAPQVVVKITSRIHGAASTLGAFTYVGRLGMQDKEAIPLLTSENEVLTNATDMMKLAREWQTWEKSDDARRKGATAIAMVFSMPPGTDPVKVREAVVELAQTDMADRRWVLALHTDEAHPHVHLIIAGRDNDGQRFNPNREFLQHAREHFAELLRERGIEADATMRITRGYPPKHDATPVIKLRERGQQPEVDQIRAEAVRGDSERGRGHLADRESARSKTSETFKDVRSVYTRAIGELEAHGGADEMARAKALRAFVNVMPPPYSARAEILERLNARAVEREVDRETTALASLADAAERIKASAAALRKNAPAVPLGDPSTERIRQLTAELQRSTAERLAERAKQAAPKPGDQTRADGAIEQSLARFVEPQDRDRERDRARDQERDLDREGPTR